MMMESRNKNEDKGCALFTVFVELANRLSFPQYFVNTLHFSFVHTIHSLYYCTVVRLSDEHLTQLGIKEKGGSQLIHSQEEFESLLTRIAQLREQDKQLYGESPRSPTSPTGYVNGNQFYSGIAVSDEHSEERDEMLRRRKGSYLQPVRVPGGSCVNTIKGLAMLGEKCGVLGKIGTDESGTFYKDNLRERGVIPLMTESSHSRTGEVLCLVTPDGQRTMRAFLGASQDMNESDLLPQVCCCCCCRTCC